MIGDDLRIMGKIFGKLGRNNRQFFEHNRLKPSSYIVHPMASSANACIHMYVTVSAK